MKKALATMLLTLSIPAFATAAIPDISELTESELIELNHKIQMSLFDQRLNDGVRVPQGTYIIGEDIPAGTYRIEIVDGSGYYDLYESEDGSLLNSGITGPSYKITDIGKITFEDGNILKIVNSSFVFYPYVGIIF